MSLKRRVRTAIEATARCTGVLAHFERRARGGLTILTYHRVLADVSPADYPLPSLVMPIEPFREQMRCISRLFDVLPLTEALARHRAGARDEKPMLAVTFDDGYADNAEIAAPILDELGIRATFFIVTEFVSGGGALWFDIAMQRLLATGRSTTSALVVVEDLKRLDARERDRVLALIGTAASMTPVTDARRFGSMTQDQIRSLARRGHEIGSHTLSHPVLVHLDDAELEREVASSKYELESWLGAAIHGLCYPNGDHDARVQRCAERAGYRWACATLAGRNDARTNPYSLRRIDVTPTRVMDHVGKYQETAFRSEISLLRGVLRHPG